MPAPVRASPLVFFDDFKLSFFLRSQPQNHIFIKNSLWALPGPSSLSLPIYDTWQLVALVELGSKEQAGSGYIGKAPRAHPVRPRHSCNGASLRASPPQGVTIPNANAQNTSVILQQLILFHFFYI